MKKWLIRICRAAGMGLGWGAAWVPVSLIVGRLIDPDDLMDEPWLIAGMLAGFPCGAVFSAVAGIADGRRALDELSVSWAGARGVVSGLLVGGLWLVVALLSDPPKWLLEGIVVGSVTLLSAVSGVATALLADWGRTTPGHTRPRCRRPEGAEACGILLSLENDEDQGPLHRNQRREDNAESY